MRNTNTTSLIKYKTDRHILFFFSFVNKIFLTVLKVSTQLLFTHLNLFALINLNINIFTSIDRFLLTYFFSLQIIT